MKNLNNFSAKDLTIAFHQSCDLSLSYQVLSLPLTKATGRSQLMGSGSDFYAILLETYPIKTVLKVNQPTSPGRWMALSKAMARLVDLQGPLIPPMRLLDFSEGLAYLMPYGDQVVPWHEVGELWSKCQHLLTNSNLQLQDIPQIRATDSIPFIVDWSDLRPLSRSSF